MHALQGEEGHTEAYISECGAIVVWNDSNDFIEVVAFKKWKISFSHQTKNASF